MTKRKKLIIAIAVILVCAAVIAIPIISHNFAHTASGNDENFRVIKYQGETYYCFSRYANQYEFERDKIVGGNIFESIYTVKGDDNHEFLVFDSLQEHYLYTSNKNYKKGTINNHFLKKKNTSISSDTSIQVINPKGELTWKI